MKAYRPDEKRIYMSRKLETELPRTIAQGFYQTSQKTALTA